tara:strand:- start:209 stop:556 length:348 start_codon:yes stop_codon:yes gene_type:complete
MLTFIILGLVLVGIVLNGLGWLWTMKFNIWVWVVIIGLFIIGYSINPDNKIVVDTPVNSTSMGDGVDLSVLGEMDGVVDYYIDNSKLYIYTVEDSINDEMDRIKFINSLDPGLGE